MVVVMRLGATDEEDRRQVVRARVERRRRGLRPPVARESSSAWSATSAASDDLNLRTLKGVADVHRISDPYKLVSRQHHPERSTIWVGPKGMQVPVGPDSFALMGGPCAVENEGAGDGVCAGEIVKDDRGSAVARRRVQAEDVAVFVSRDGARTGSS